MTPLINRKSLVILILLLFANIKVLVAQDADRELLLKNISSVPVPVANGEIFTTYIGKLHAQIIATVEIPNGSQDQFTAIVTSRLGKGKIIIFGSPTYFRKPLLEKNEVKTLIKNTLSWGGYNKNSGIQLWGNNTDLLLFLKREQYKVNSDGEKFIKSKTNILILTEDVQDSVKRNNIASFIRLGGTLVFGSSFLETRNNGEQSTQNLGLNSIFKEAGLLHAFDSVKPQSENLIIESFLAYLHISSLLKSIKNNEGVSNMIASYIAGTTMKLAVELNAVDSPLISYMKQVIHLDQDSLIIPTAQNPVDKKDHILFTKYIIQQTIIEKQLQEQKNIKYIAPAGKIFPGEVSSEAPRINERIIIPVQVGTQGLPEPKPLFYRWHSTGFYVPAGEKVIVNINQKNIKLRLKAQIGVHDENLLYSEGDNIKREAFGLVKTFELKNELTEIYSPYGGILLINIPDTTTLKTVTIEVNGPIKYPYFKLGKTSIKEWQESIRHYKAPWAELATDKIIITVPASRIRELDDPEKVVKFWDEVMDTNARLAQISPNRTHPERMIVDEQLTVGSMNASESKIMMLNNEFTFRILDEAFMRANGSWGHFHELGHRHQFRGIDFDALLEVSANLYTMYVYDKLLKKGIYNSENTPSKEAVISKVKAYMADKPSFQKFSSNPFLALNMYIQLIEGFGWQSIEQVYKKYRALPKEQYPISETERIDYWFTSICAATQKDLSTFFDKWQIPISSNVKSEAAKYPKWLPEELK